MKDYPDFYNFLDLLWQKGNVKNRKFVKLRNSQKENKIREDNIFHFDEIIPPLEGYLMCRKGFVANSLFYR